MNKQSKDGIIRLKKEGLSSLRTQCRDCKKSQFKISNGNILRYSDQKE